MYSGVGYNFDFCDMFCVFDVLVHNFNGFD